MPDEVKVDEYKEPVKKRQNKFEMIFATIIIFMVAGYLYGITFHAIPKGNERVVDTVLGFILGSVISPIVIWAFRSSKAQIDKENAEFEVKQLKREGGE